MRSLSLRSIFSDTQRRVMVPRIYWESQQSRVQQTLKATVLDAFQGRMSKAQLFKLHCRLEVFEHKP